MHRFVEKFHSHRGRLLRESNHRILITEEKGLARRHVFCYRSGVALICLDHVTRFYGPRRGVEDLSLEVEPGSLFGFLGPNGAGKTTTIRVLLGFLQPT